jgi:hypothetical protein
MDGKIRKFKIQNEPMKTILTNIIDKQGEYKKAFKIKNESLTNSNPKKIQKVQSKNKKNNQFLGKRKITQKTYKEIFGKYQREKLLKMTKTISDSQKATEQIELEYKFKWRMIQEKWKRALIKKFPISVSFKIHNLEDLSSR